MATTYAIPAGNLYMNATTYTGTGAALSIANGAPGASFQPDMVWVKSRSGVTNHYVKDVVRGINNQLYTNSATNEASSSNTISAFNSNGFSVGTDAELNANGGTYVGWNWKAGGTAVSNTTGTITTSVSANTTSGFSILTYTGSGAAGSLGHGLGATPAMIITKNRTTAGNSWIVWHKSLTGATSNPTGYAYLDQNAAASTTTNFYNGTAMTTTTFSWFGGNINVNSTSNNYVSYCWAEIAGYSKFGSYTGNGSADGPFNYTGFRPRWLMIKCVSTTGEWVLVDTSRSPYNSEQLYIYANGTSAETGSFAILDGLSNGFKLRDGWAQTNTSGATYIYAAFAENPFKYANAR